MEKLLTNTQLSCYFALQSGKIQIQRCSRVFLSGPGYREYSNIYNKFEHLLRNTYKCHVLNPVEIDPANELSETEMFSHCINSLIDCDIVLMLPQWDINQNSKAELEVARALNKKIIFSFSENRNK